MLTFEAVSFARRAFTLTANCDVDGPGITAVIGPSGSGKSTLLSLIAGFEAPDAGRILWQGKDIGGLAPGDRPVAVLFQDGNLFPHIDVLSNVILGVTTEARPGAHVRDRALAALSRVGLDGMETRKPGELSGGQQSRAALARVLLTDRPVLLLDEAFAALGPALRAEMLALVAELLPDKTILMVTHDPEDAKRAAGATIFVDEGMVHAPRETGELFADPPAALNAYLA